MNSDGFSAILWGEGEHKLPNMKVYKQKLLKTKRTFVQWI